MIRFCDKEVFIIHREEVTRSELISFFLKSELNRTSVIIYLDEEDNYYGMTTYKKVLENYEEEQYICKDVLIADDEFWVNAKEYFEDKESEIRPVLNKSGDILGFCWDDKNIKDSFFYFLEELEKVDFDNIPFTLKEWNEKIQLICITDMNEWAWRTYLLFQKMGYPVCVIGEKWEWFGLKQMEGYIKYPEYAKLYIYAEGTKYFRKSKEDFCNSNSREILGAFSVLRHYIGKIQSKIYRQKISQLAELGVNICKCIVPKISEIEVITKDERKSMLLKTDYRDYLGYKEYYTKERINNLVSIFGKESFEQLLENGVCVDSRGWKLLLNNIGGKYLETEKTSIKRIYIIGPCIVAGGGCLSKDTLSANIQKLVRNDGYVVVKIPYRREDIIFLEKLLYEIPLRKGDIVLLVDEQNRLGSIEGDECLLKDVYNNTERESWFSNGIPFHVNRFGTEVIAQHIYNEYLNRKIEELNKFSEEDRIYLQKGEIIDETLRSDINNYVESVKDDIVGDKKIGAIVMNCNPFTLGHQYLIEYAAYKMDYMYIFVVEEDKSVFKFKDRFKMVQEGTKHLSNVKVVPSGKWVLSYETLPIYFGKSEHQEDEVDASMDLEIFARYIAPKLNISYRFVGEEPQDKITKQYNEQMKLILSDFDIDVVEISRKEYENKPISASLVRNFINEGNMELIKDYVPETTYKILKSI